MLADHIIEAWNYQIPSRWEPLSELPADYPAWALTLPDSSKCVAIPYDDNSSLVNEEFSSVRLFSTSDIKGFPSTSALVLSCESPSRSFATLCAEFVSPGENGSFRKAMSDSPVAWWTEWKTLLGNRNVDSRVYDVLGEMLSLEYLATRGLNPYWSGPSKSSCDIECESEMYEVKSTTVRNSKIVTMHGLYQAASINKPKYLIFCRFEPTVDGITINKLSERLSRLGLNADYIEGRLAELGYPKGKSARTKSYTLLDMIMYPMDQTFPGIRPEAFITGSLPQGVTSVSYSVSLDGLNGKRLIESPPIEK